MVPSERRCSSDFPIVWVGRNSTRRSSGRRPSTVLIRPSAIAVSVTTGRCGPCCSVEATGKIASVEFGSSPANSLDLSSAQNRLVIMSPSVPVCAATDALAPSAWYSKSPGRHCTGIPAKSNQRTRKRRSSPRFKRRETCSSSLLKNPRQNESSLIQFFYHESVEARMRGAFTDQGQLFSYISPEARVRTDHPLRKIRKLVRDVLGELSLSLSRLYASEGRPSIPPERLLS